MLHNVTQIFLFQMHFLSFGKQQCIKLIFLYTVYNLVSPAGGISFMEMCGMDKNWICNKNIDKVPMKVVEICEICGYYWGNVPGFGYCCRCSPKIFDFCVIAIFG